MIFLSLLRAMDPIWLHLLFHSGLLSLTLCIQPEYILIKQSMMWADAQTYCRKHHTDLATVQSNENWTRLQEAANEHLFTDFAWIGLYNDIKGWRWSYKGESMVFSSWASNQPDNYATGEPCAAISPDGTWSDFPCSILKYYVCYDETANTTEKSMVLSKTTRTWTEAQQICRDRYTDLAIIRSKEDQYQITSLLEVSAPAVWIGLYRDTWKWSDQANVTYVTQQAIQSFTWWNENCAGLDIYSRRVDDRSCATTYYFYCKTVKRKRQVIRVQVKSGQNVDEATLKVLVLNKLKQTLNNQDVTLTWRTQTDGKVFQKNKTVRKRSEANATSVCSLK